MNKHIVKHIVRIPPGRHRGRGVSIVVFLVATLSKIVLLHACPPLRSVVGFIGVLLVVFVLSIPNLGTDTDLFC